MDKDIKITLIATGFETSPLNGNKINEAEITGYLDKLKGESEEQMDVPAFLRHAQLHSVIYLPRFPLLLLRLRNNNSRHKNSHPAIHGTGSITLKLRRGLG
jgi:hypothetical protein